MAQREMIEKFKFQELQTAYGKRKLTIPTSNQLLTINNFIHHLNSFILTFSSKSLKGGEDEITVQ